MIATNCTVTSCCGHTYLALTDLAQEEEAVIEVEAESAIEISPTARRVVVRARKKFDQLDLDGNDKLNSDELLGLADWIWNSFHPGGAPLNETERREEGNKLLSRLDANKDKEMDFEEFTDW